MMTIKAGRPLIDLAKLCYQADQPLLLVGPHGVGKSEMLGQAARELGIDCVVMDLSLMEPTDLIGLPRERDGRTVYCPPASLPANQRSKGLLVFEELNRAPPYMRAPCLQLLTARRLNEYRLPPGWLPAAAVNPSDGVYDVAELDPATRSRFVEAEVVADHAGWLDWARGAGVHADVVAYVASDPAVFNTPRSNPRAWTNVSRILCAAERTRVGPDAVQVRVAVSGLVGDERADSFWGFVRKRVRPLTANEVLDQYPSHRERLRDWVECGKLDLVQHTLWAVQTLLQARHHFDRVRADRQAWKNLGHFLGDLPGDLREEAGRFLDEHCYHRPRARRKVP
jgi:hypothetical protein